MMNKNHKTIRIIIIIFLLSLLINPIIYAKGHSNDNSNNNGDIQKVSSPLCNIDTLSYKYRFFPIFIDENSDLEHLKGRLNGVIKGKGTEHDPYIISGWELSCNSLFWKMLKIDYAITINNVDKYIIVKNNFIHNWDKTHGADVVTGAIYVSYSSNIVIENNFIQDNVYGVVVSESTNCAIFSNNVISNVFGISSHCSHTENPILIYDNIVKNNLDGFRCVESNSHIYNNEIFNNDDGIILLSDSSIIKNNHIYENLGTGIKSLDSQSIIENNDIQYNNEWGIYINGGPTCNVSRNDIKYNKASGIYITECNPSIENNTISYNEEYGIYNSDNNAELYIAHNTIEGHPIGILPRSNSKIVYNNIIMNTEIGINAGDSNPIINYNNFEGNTWGLTRSGMSPWVTATYNWWGSADGPSGYGPGSGDPVTYQAIITPWLTTPCSSAGPD